MSFYITLPSNASENTFPNNKAGHFFVKLPQTIDISSQFEVGLVEIQFPNQFCNVLEDDLWIEYQTPPKDGKVKITLKVPPGIYTDIDHIINTLDQQISELETILNKVDVMHLYKHLKKVVLKVYDQGAELKISEKFKKLFGFPYAEVNDSVPVLLGEFAETEMNNTITNVFVYCDIVAARPVGDAMVPLLRTVPIMDKSTISVFRIYDKPHYIPLSRFSFDTVEILLTNDLGQTIPFISGISVVTLHFRTRKHFELE